MYKLPYYFVCHDNDNIISSTAINTNRLGTQSNVGIKKRSHSVRLVNIIIIPPVVMKRMRFQTKSAGKKLTIILLTSSHWNFGGTVRLSIYVWLKWQHLCIVWEQVRQTLDERSVQSEWCDLSTVRSGWDGWQKQLWKFYLTYRISTKMVECLVPALSWMHICWCKLHLICARKETMQFDKTN